METETTTTETKPIRKRVINVFRIPAIEILKKFNLLPEDKVLPRTKYFLKVDGNQLGQEQELIVNITVSERAI